MKPTAFTISRTKILTTDFALGIAAGCTVFAGMLAYSWYFSLWRMLCLMFGMILLCLYIAIRRFLRSITIDSQQEVLVARSLIPWITFTIPFAAVKVIKTVKRHGGYNLAIRRLNMIQPLLFEVWTTEENRDVQSFLAMLTSHGLSIKQQAAVSGVT